MRTIQKLTQLPGNMAKVIIPVLLGFWIIVSCTKNYTSSDGYIIPPKVVTQSPSSSSACSCSTTTPGSTTTTPGSTTTTAPGSSTTTPGSATTTPGSATTTPGNSTTAAAVKIDSLKESPPRFLPNGGNFYFSTTVNLSADTLPPQAVYEYSLDNGQNWKTGQRFTLTAGGNVLTRFRAGDRVSRSRVTSFSIYYQRMLVVGNSIMFHGPAPELGWSNSNGMAASAPEKDFVHLLTADLQTLNPAMTLRLQAGTGLELDFGKSTYKMDEFDEALSSFKPDLIIVRIGENVSDGEVTTRNFEGQFRQLIEKLQTYGQPVRIVTTTSVWEKPQTDAAIRNVINGKGLPLVDLSCMVGQSQFFAPQFSNKNVAAHPGDAGMQKIADFLWDKIR